MFAGSSQPVEDAAKLPLLALDLLAEGDEVGSAPNRAGGSGSSGEEDGAGRPLEDSPGRVEHFRALEQGADPGSGRSFGRQAIGQRMGAGPVRLGAWFDG